MFSASDTFGEGPVSWRGGQGLMFMYHPRKRSCLCAFSRHIARCIAFLKRGVGLSTYLMLLAAIIVGPPSIHPSSLGSCWRGVSRVHTKEVMQKRTS